jgi:hypothetical protein
LCFFASPHLKWCWKPRQQCEYPRVVHTTHDLYINAFVSKKLIKIKNQIFHPPSVLPLSCRTRVWTIGRRFATALLSVWRSYRNMSRRFSTTAFTTCADFRWPRQPTCSRPSLDRSLEPFRTDADRDKNGPDMCSHNYPPRKTTGFITTCAFVFPRTILPYRCIIINTIVTTAVSRLPERAHPGNVEQWWIQDFFFGRRDVIRNVVIILGSHL